MADTVTITLNSDRYPSFGFVVSDRPIIGGQGTLEIGMGRPMEVSSAVAAEIKEAIRQLPERNRRHLSLTVSAPTPAVPLVAGAVDAPTPAAAIAPTPAPPSTVVETTPAQDEMQELVDAEIAKLLKVAAIREREPLVIGIATNPDFPLSLRRAYLEAVQAHPQVQRALKNTAQQWLDTITTGEPEGQPEIAPESDPEA